MTGEREKTVFVLNDVIKGGIDKDPLLIAERGINLQILDEKYFTHVAKHYQEAFNRGDFFGTRYPDPANQIFNSEWWKKEISNPNHIWIILTQGQGGELVGSTGLFYENGAVSIDETQIAAAGRGLKIMDHYFRRIVPVLDSLGLDIVTEFLLTVQSKGLRKTLQQELGMTALGIHPHYLFHRALGIRASEISAAKYHNLESQKASLVPELAELFHIVGGQILLPEPEIVSLTSKPKGELQHVKKYMEVLVGASDPYDQRLVLDEGFQPVKYDPKQHVFTMAKFPFENPNLDFIIAEGIEPNTKLVQYMSSSLFGGRFNERV